MCGIHYGDGSCLSYMMFLTNLVPLHGLFVLFKVSCFERGKGLRNGYRVYHELLPTYLYFEDVKKLLKLQTVILQLWLPAETFYKKRWRKILSPYKLGLSTFRVL